jgi:hypothetical protein
MNAAIVAKEPEIYFYNPVPIGFYLDALDDTSDPPEEGVTLREVWCDPMARTFWLAIKSRHITSQYFRRWCLDAAGFARRSPPAAWMALQGTLWSVCGTSSSEVARQLWPYIVRILIDEGLWGAVEDIEPHDHKIKRLEREIHLLRNPEDGDDVEPPPRGQFIPWIIPVGVASAPLRYVYRKPVDPSKVHPWRHGYFSDYYGYQHPDGWQRAVPCKLCGKCWYDLIHVEGPRLP